MWDAMQDPSRRQEVVNAYQEAGQGRHRYGVVCPKCNKRICPQGPEFAYTNPKQYCLCPEQYEPDTHESIWEILQAHGLPPMDLKVQPNMHESPRRKRGKKKKKVSKAPEQSTPKPDWPSFADLLRRRKDGN